jgi:endonuclease/exonuclease/phosphatase family metal-dependent hydrolase
MLKTICHRGLLQFFVFICTSSFASAEPFSILSLNIHGPHPMGEGERFYEYKNGKTEKAPTNLFFFKLDEIERGNSRRVQRLANDIELVRPDIILLQEVTAGYPHRNKSCLDFYHNVPHVGAWKNTALQLQESVMLDYKSHLACRGNIGWTTNHKTFETKRIIKKNKFGRKEVVFNWFENPYPQGMVMEGTAILTSPKIKVLKHFTEHIEFNQGKDRVFVQFLKFKVFGKSGWYLLANVHLGHKLAHFEQAIELRRYMSLVVKEEKTKDFKGYIIGGDFNARLFNVTDREAFSEISTTPYEVKNKRFDFYFRENGNQKKNMLLNGMMDLNFNSSYKPWASVYPYALAEQRIKHAIKRFESWQKESSFDSTMKKHIGLKESVFSHPNECKDSTRLDTTCYLKNRIDFIFSSHNLEVKEQAILYKGNNWTDLQGVSDHPGVYVKYR